MSTKKPANDYTGRAIARFCLLAAVYIGLIFVLPASQRSMHEYMLSPGEYRILYLAVSVPFLVSWLAAFIGYSKLSEYADAVATTPEGPSFKRLAQGCAWLAWGLPIQNFATLLLYALAANHSSLHEPVVIVSNYVSLILPLIALSVISSASKRLTESANLTFSPVKARSIIMAFIAAGLIYCYLILQHFDLSSLGNTNNPYYLPLWLMVITIIIPYLYAWFVGLIAAYEIAIYSRNVKGVLYRQSLSLLILGLIAVVVGSIALQYINSAAPRLGYLALNYKLLWVSVFRIIGGIGFVLIALGALRLKKIEEV